VAAVIRFVGYRVSMKIACVIGSLLFLRPKRRSISIRNVRAAFPEKSEREIRDIGKRSMQGMVKVIFEFILIPGIAANSKKYVEVQGVENMWRALELNKGVVLAVSHFGNWELMGMASGAEKLPIHAIGKPTKNPLVYNYIKHVRGLTGMRCIDQEGAIKRTIQLLKENQVVAMLVDERVKDGTVLVDFFGRKTAASSLPATLGLKYGAAIIPAFYYRGETERSIYLFGKPFDLISTGNRKKDLAANTQQYMTRLEEEIRKRPSDWTLWMHNRWESHSA